jgi:sugar/nucleoside kinase (ribokinase family)
MVGQYGNDDSGKILVNALNNGNVNTSYMTKLDGVETGQAYIFSYPGDNSIILYGAANMAWDNNDLALFKESIRTCIIFT